MCVISAFYEFLKNASENTSAFNYFNNDLRDLNSSNLSQSQQVAVQAGNGMEISRQFFLDQNNAPFGSAISITAAITVTIAKAPSVITA